jgi:hypothetical protein
MRYRVTFAERFGAEGQSTEQPAQFVEVSEGVVQDAVFVERFAPDNLHVQEVMDEDDSFLSRGTEVWEYDITEGREREFLEALQNSQRVIEYVELDAVPE